MKDLKIIMMILWAGICIISLILLALGVFGFIPESRTHIVTPIAFVTLIIGIPTLIVAENAATNLHK